MNLENKQRIVGVVVLVAFIALLIPFLFSSGVKKNNQLATPSPSESGVPVEVTNGNLSESNSSAIGETANVAQKPIEDLKDKTLPEAMQQQSAPSVQPVIIPEAQPKEKIGSVQEASENSAQVPSLPSSTEIIAEPTVASAPATLTTALETKPASSKVTAKKVAPSKPPYNTQKSVNKGGIVKKGWSVQIGSFSNQSRVKKMVADLQAQGFKVSLQNIKTARGPMVRVLVGRESSKDKAMEIANQLKTKSKINGHVIWVKL